MNGCTLEIAGTVISRSDGGALEAEYALFDASEIELRATEYGAIREIGYRTTAADALARLDAAGATTAAIRDVASAVQSVARSYAPPSALPLHGIVNPAELLTADRFDPERRVYSSPLLDFGRLATETGVPGAAAALQAVGLAAWLRETPPDAEVVLHTADYMAPRRPGERSIRRISLAGLRSLTPAIQRLRDTPSQQPSTPPPALGHDAMIAWFRSRGATGERVEWAQLALANGQHTEAGPLNDPRALAIDALFRAGRNDEAVPLVDRLEVETGRTAAVHYLRLRGALESEPPLAVAERATALLDAEPSAELKLLAARAWSEAGDAQRAVRFAQEVLTDPTSTDPLRDDARRYAEPTRASEHPDEATTDVRPQGAVTRMVPDAAVTRMPSRPPALTAAPTAPAQMRPSAPALVLDLPRPPVPNLSGAGIGVPMSKRPTPVAGRPAEADPLQSVPPPFIMGLTGAPQAMGAPTPAPPAPTAPPPVATIENPHRASGAPTRSMAPKTTPPTAASYRPSVDGSVPPGGSYPPYEVISSLPPLGSFRPGSHEGASGSNGDSSFRPGPPDAAASRWPRGASRPPFQSAPVGNGPIMFSHEAAPFERRPPEVAENLSLPPGLHGQAVPFDAVPRSVAEARVQFTLLSRTLGRTYRERRGEVLCSDLGGIELMQTTLREHFTVPAIRSAEEAGDVRRHGAFLSEILARTFGAEWVDIAPSELGYWAMATPSGLRLFPFGRILRFILQGDDRDLVSYYLELEGRSRR